MDAKKKRLTLDLEPSLRQRLEAVAALKGISIGQYCQNAIDKELAFDEAQGASDLPFGEEALDRLAALQNEIFRNGRLLGDSADLIREARATRA